MGSRQRLSFLSALLLLTAASAGAKNAKGPVPVGEPFAISPCPDCREGAPLVAGNAEGRFFALWSDEESRLRGRIFELDGEPGPLLLLAEDRMSRPGSVAARPDGDFQAAWLWPNQVHVQRFGRSSVQSPILVTSAPAGGDDDNAWLAIRPDGGMILLTGRTFGPERPSEVRSQILSADGSPLGTPEIVDTPFGRGAPVACALPDGGAAVVWERLPGPLPGQPPPKGLAIGRLAANGSPEHSILLAAPPGTPAWSLGHTVACGSDGTFAAAWHTRDSPARSGSDIVFHILRPEGPGLQASFGVISSKGDQSDPALLHEPGRGWLAVWSSFDKGKSEIRARRISPSGRLQGREIVLHRTARGRRADYPSLARVGNLFVLTWVEDGRARGRFFKP